MRRWFDGEHWGRLERLTTAPEGDFDQQVARGKDGTIHLDVAGFPRRAVRRLLPQLRWRALVARDQLSDSTANDWAPGVAADSKGNAYVIWDTYDRGDYDVVGKVVRPGGEAGAARHRLRHRLLRGAPGGRGRRRGSRVGRLRGRRQGLGQGHRHADRCQASTRSDAQRRAFGPGARPHLGSLLGRRAARARHALPAAQRAALHHHQEPVALGAARSPSTTAAACIWWCARSRAPGRASSTGSRTSPP